MAAKSSASPGNSAVVVDAIAAAPEAAAAKADEKKKNDDDDEPSWLSSPLSSSEKVERRRRQRSCCRWKPPPSLVLLPGEGVSAIGSQRAISSGDRESKGLAEGSGAAWRSFIYFVQNFETFFSLRGVPNSNPFVGQTLDHRKKERETHHLDR